jgi:hypothetical protein
MITAHVSEILKEKDKIFILGLKREIQRINETRIKKI